LNLQVTAAADWKSVNPPYEKRWHIGGDLRELPSRRLNLQVTATADWKSVNPPYEKRWRELREPFEYASNGNGGLEERLAGETGAPPYEKHLLTSKDFPISLRCQSGAFRRKSSFGYTMTLCPIITVSTCPVVRTFLHW